MKPGRVLLVALYLAALGLLAALAWHGRSYYLTPTAERARHELYWDLKPGGRLGLRYGIGGASLMVVMLVYSLRKRLRPLRKLGMLSGWLDLHIFCGITGPLFILLHSSFKVGGLVALAFWSMVAVAASGVLGRFLYLQIPRRRSGDELSLAEVEQERTALAAELGDRFGLSTEALARLDALAAGGVGTEVALPALLARLPFDGLALRWRLRRFRRSDLPADLPRRSERRLMAVVRRRVWLERRIRLWRRLQELFHYWHVVHKPFAIVMYVFMVVHIAVALTTGYGWSP